MAYSLQKQKHLPPPPRNILWAILRSIRALRARSPLFQGNPVALLSQGTFGFLFRYALQLTILHFLCVFECLWGIVYLEKQDSSFPMDSKEFSRRYR